jgi:hypothetical protein
MFGENEHCTSPVSPRDHSPTVAVCCAEIAHPALTALRQLYDPTTDSLTLSPTAETFTDRGD